jgi:polyhydroxybutyrate depolymerase
LPAQGQARGVQYTDCANGAELVFYTIVGSGHAWPGGRPLPKFIVGQTNADIDATRIMWAFFQQHPMPGENQEY